MFDIGAGEVLVLLVLGVLIFGPERLPKLAADAARMIRELRRMAQGARSQLGPEFENINLSDLNPRTFVAKHLLDGEDYSVDLDLDLKDGARRRSRSGRSAASKTVAPVSAPETSVASTAPSTPVAPPSSGPVPAPSSAPAESLPPQHTPRPRYDIDST